MSFLLCQPVSEERSPLMSYPCPLNFMTKNSPLSNSKLLLRIWISRHRVALQTQIYLKTGPQDSVLPVLLQVEPNKRAQAPPAETLMGKDQGAPGACRSSLMSTLHVNPDLETLSGHGDRGIQGDLKSGRDVVRQCSCLEAGGGAGWAPERRQVLPQ